MQRPALAEIAPFYHGYLARLPDAPLLATLRRGRDAVQELVRSLDDERALHRYAPGKWSVKEVLCHLADGERVFAYRLLRFARGDDTPLPGFDEAKWIAAAHSDRRPLAAIGEELRAVRDATLALVDSLDEAECARSGLANGSPATVRALAHVIAGHELHHLAVLRERYGAGERAAH